jgi:hypothetical protein
MKIHLLCLGLITTLGVALSVPMAGQLPFARPESNINTDFPIVSEDTAKYFDHLRRRYGIKGLSIAVAASPTYTGEGWLNQTISLGEADVRGSKVTDQVSPLPRCETDCRHCLQLHPIPSCLRRSLLRYWLPMERYFQMARL